MNEAEFSGEIQGTSRADIERRVEELCIEFFGGPQSRELRCWEITRLMVNPIAYARDGSALLYEAEFTARTKE